MTKNRKHLSDLAVDLAVAQTSGDRDEVDRVHRQMHDLDPKGRVFECNNCPLTK